MLTRRIGRDNRATIYAFNDPQITVTDYTPYQGFRNCIVDFDVDLEQFDVTGRESGKSYFYGRPPTVKGGTGELVLQRYSAAVDYVRHCREMFGSWDFVTQRPRSTRDNPVSHLNLCGEVSESVSADFGDIMSFESRVFDAPTDVQRVDTIAGHALKTRVSTLVGPDNLMPLVDWVAWFKELVGNGKVYVNIAGAMYSWSYHDVSYVITPEEICFKFAMYITYDAGPPYNHRLYYVHVWAGYDIIGVPGEELLPWDCIIHPYFYMTSLYRLNTYFSDRVERYSSYRSEFLAKPLGGKTPWGTTGVSFYTYDLSEVFSNSLGSNAVEEFTGSYETTPGTLYYTGPYCLKQFARSITPVLGDAYATSVDSSREALDKALSDMGTNMFEASQDAGALLGLLDCVDLLRRVYALRKGKISPNLWKDVLDILADADLVYSFGLAPTARDAVSIAEGAAEYKRKYFDGGIFNYATYRGKAEYPAGDFVPGFPETTLVTRSKLRLRANPDMVFQILPLEAAGLLPRMSTLWECIPWSFAVDWLFPIGRFLDLADTTFLFEALEIAESNHSINFEWPVPSNMLHWNGMWEPLGSEEECLVYRYYERFILPNVPSPMPSVFLASIEPVSLHYDVVGSLLWGLVKQ